MARRSRQPKLLSPKTVEHHVSRIFVKLGVRTRAEAAAAATIELQSRTGEFD